MYRIESKVDTKSPEFKANREAMLKLSSQLRENMARIKKGGPEYMVERHHKRGKLTARERLDLLFDRNTPFIELSPLAAWGEYKDEAPSAGMVTGIGVVHGREVLVVANDATVKGGTYYPLTIKKHVRAQQVAMENRLPCVYLVDSGGIFLPHQSGGYFTTRRDSPHSAFRRSRLSWDRALRVALMYRLCRMRPLSSASRGRFSSVDRRS